MNKLKFTRKTSLWLPSTNYPAGVGIFFSSQLHPDRLWGPPGLPSNWYRGLLPRG